MEFETCLWSWEYEDTRKLEFTPLEFETPIAFQAINNKAIRIYSVGVWNSTTEAMALKTGEALEFTPLEFETYKKSLAY